MLIVPAIYLGAVPRGTPPPAFDVSSATPPSAFQGPRATWLSAERIVLEPEIVPYGPPATSTTVADTQSVPLRAERGGGGGKDDADSHNNPSKPSKAALGAAVPTTSTTTTAAIAPGTTTTMPPTTTTTLASVVNLPPALTPVAPAGTGTATRTDRGPASWFDAPEGTCAHTTIPKGTEITVTRTSTGESTTCVVDDWGPADTSRIIDLSLDTFEQLASPEEGLIDVTIEW